ncbi:hypothetical protein EXIGLDRAFT_699753 [Exidia glandulosa HHB12029]|uniref:Nonribosomal peptide synthetase 12 n=1 Tax=Exidia glandulosa HHB12029 TaxID=1314781 RepID=A0A165DQW6_EXIGL|nr:hypothetical protein EXIGLDRAFT_699753 [Exidia glandulosa HHB12029]
MAQNESQPRDLEKNASAAFIAEVSSPHLPLEGDEDVRESVELPPTLPSGTPQPASSSSSLDKKELEGETTVSIEPVTLPRKAGNRVTRFLFHNFFSTYRKSFAVIFAVNLAVFVGLTVSTHGSPNPSSVGSAASANLMVAILFRQENFVNIVYEIFANAPLSWPLSIRKRLAKVFHYGGCHSGCGVAAVVWYFLYTALVTRDYVRDPAPRHWDLLANMITSWILICMFFGILGGAHPTFRRKHHDAFEAFHRFSGWIALCTFWIHNVISARVTARETSSTIGMVLVASPNFWCISISTACTLLSWSRLRLREVYPEKLSDHATRLHFKYHAMQPFYGVKVSDRPLTEWHAFATIPDTDPTTGKINGFSVVVSNAGDWTKRQIMQPNSKLWIRGYPLHGLLYTSRLFRKIVVVATGSGIGPCLSLLFADYTPRRVFWSTPAPEKTYGPGVMGAVLKADPDAVIWDTRKEGRPDMVLETFKLVQESGAEAVFIISNPKLTGRVVYGMQTRGIAAYGAIFDS